MKNYRKGSHTVYLLHYQFVFIPKYRKPILRADVGQRLRELIRLICHANEIEIVQGHICCVARPEAGLVADRLAVRRRAGTELPTRNAIECAVTAKFLAENALVTEPGRQLQTASLPKRWNAAAALEIDDDLARG